MNATNATAAFWVTVVVVSFFIRLAMSFCYPAISDVISNFMSSNMSYGLLSNILKNFSLCAKYAFFHTIITMVTDIAIFFAIYGVTKLFSRSSECLHSHLRLFVPSYLSRFV